MVYEVYEVKRCKSRKIPTAVV